MADTAISRTRQGKGMQAAIGLGLAATIFTAWLAIHIFSLFVLDISWMVLPLVVILGAVQCWLSVGLFIVSHDAMHGSLVPPGISGARRINAAVGAVLLFLYAGFGWRRMRDAHFTHHQLAGHPGDPDFDEANPRSFARWYWTFLKRYFGAGSMIYVWAVVLTYWLVLDVPVQNIVLLYGAPAIISSMQLFYFGTFRPHRHESTSYGMPFADRHNARSERFGVLASLASCFHFGYHHEHHLHPETPWWKLPALRRAALNEEPPEPSVP